MILYKIIATVALVVTVVTVLTVVTVVTEETVVPAVTKKKKIDEKFFLNILFKVDNIFVSETNLALWAEAV